MTTVAIIDSGGANIASIKFALDRLGAKAALTADAATILAADKVILPGVGAAKTAMERLDAANLADVIRELKQPVLGICLGMQLLCEASEEEDVKCLGILSGVARKLRGDSNCPVPNMGWCATRTLGTHPLLNDIEPDSYFYFVHSYAISVGDSTIAVAEHKLPFSAAISAGNFMATQFHPERSSKTGAKVIENFLGLRA